MYRVKGADQKEYGPVSFEQVQQWIRENRLNRFSLVEKDGEPGWKPLAQFPEFADLVPPPPSGTPPTAVPGTEAHPAGAGADPVRAAEMLNAPSLILLGFAVMGLLLTIAGPFMKPIYANAMESFIETMKLPMDDRLRAQLEAARTAGLSAGDIFSLALGIGINVVILLGGLKMRKLQSWGLALAATVLVMLPCGSPCCCLGLPLGIWMVLLLNRPEIKASFTQ